MCLFIYYIFPQYILQSNSRCEDICGKAIGLLMVLMLLESRKKSLASQHAIASESRSPVGLAQTKQDQLEHQLDTKADRNVAISQFDSYDRHVSVGNNFSFQDPTNRKRRQKHAWVRTGSNQNQLWLYNIS
jgi:hypothetical protein